MAKSAKSKEIKVKEKSGTSVDTVPEWMKDKRGKGTESLSSADIEIPRIVLLHAGSPQVTEGRGLPGEFYHLVTEESLGKEVRIVPLYTDVRHILWRPRDDGGGVLARADDGVHWVPANQSFEVKLKGGKVVTWQTTETVQSSGLAEWGSSDPDDPESVPASTRMYCVAVALPDRPELGPSLLTLQRSAVKVARRLVSKLKISGAPSFGCYYKMGTMIDEGPDGKFFNYTFTANGFVQDVDEFKHYEEMYETFAKMGLRIRDIDAMQTEEGEEAPNAKNNENKGEVSEDSAPGEAEY